MTALHYRYVTERKNIIEQRKKSGITCRPTSLNACEPCVNHGYTMHLTTMERTIKDNSMELQMLNAYLTNDQVIR